MGKSSITAKLLSAGAIAMAAFFVQSCQQSPGGDLYLTQPFCLDRAMESSFNCKMLELSNAVENEKRTHTCFEALESIRPETRAPVPAELDRLDSYLEFALACSSPKEKAERNAQRLAARRIDAEISSMFFKAAALQKALDDAGALLSKEEAEKLRQELETAKLALLRAICFPPLDEAKVDTESLDAIVNGMHSEADELPVPKALLQTEDGTSIDLGRADELLARVGASSAQRKRLLLIAGYKAAKVLLDPESGSKEKLLAYTAAKLAREGIARAKYRDASAEFAKLNSDYNVEAKRGLSQASASAIVLRDLSLGRYCAAKELARDVDGEEMLKNHGLAIIPASKKGSEPPDPSLVETPVELELPAVQPQQTPSNHAAPATEILDH